MSQLRRWGARVLIFLGYKEHICEGVAYVLKLMLANHHQVKRKKIQKFTEEDVYLSHGS